MTARTSPASSALTSRRGCGVGATGPSSADLAADRQAMELLLMFARLYRSPRRAPEAGALPARLAQLMAQGELAPRHLGVLAVIGLEGPLSVSELAGREGLAVSTASLLVTQLADCGLVERHEDEHDRRRTVVSVSPDHRRESEALARAKLVSLRRALERMGPARAKALLEGLAILAEEVGRPDGDGNGDGAPDGVTVKVAR